jgi:hypothetical protein
MTNFFYAVKPPTSVVPDNSILFMPQKKKIDGKLGERSWPSKHKQASLLRNDIHYKIDHADD